MDRYQSTDSSILCHFIGLADSHITGHKFSRFHCCRGRDLVSVYSLWVQLGGLVSVCAAASSLPDCFEAGCLGVYEVRPRGCSCPLSSAVSSV